MEHYRGLTWDHPRGRIWLDAATILWRERGIEVTWEVQPLEGFEASPIDELCLNYDLVVLDHPHLGDALATNSLQPLESVFRDVSASFNGPYVGPSLRSYRIDDHTWALPIDAATQVSARDLRAVTDAPLTWEGVVALAGESCVALSLAGPHALLSLFSVASALGVPPVDEPGESWLSDSTALDALEVLRSVHALSRTEYAELNPIGLLERLASDDPLAYVPLVYGYVNYSVPRRSVPIAFGNAPRASATGVPGSTIGGTGVAVTKGAHLSGQLQEYLSWLVAESTQCRVIPEFEGQPASQAAWSDPAVDHDSGGFYSATRDTIEESVVRPRYAGFPEAQQVGSEIVREALEGKLGVHEAVRRLGALAHSSRSPARGARS